MFTENRRDVTLITMPAKDGAPERKVALVAVGAMLSVLGSGGHSDACSVGSITWTVKQGDATVKGDEQGYFSYGGSTCIAVFERGSIKFDDDLVENSRNALETQGALGTRSGGADSIQSASGCRSGASSRAAVTSVQDESGVRLLSALSCQRRAARIR